MSLLICIMYFIEENSVSLHQDYGKQTPVAIARAENSCAKVCRPMYELFHIKKNAIIEVFRAS